MRVLSNSCIRKRAVVWQICWKSRALMVPPVKRTKGTIPNQSSNRPMLLVVRLVQPQQLELRAGQLLISRTCSKRCQVASINLIRCLPKLKTPNIQWRTRTSKWSHSCSKSTKLYLLQPIYHSNSLLLSTNSFCVSAFGASTCLSVCASVRFQLICDFVELINLVFIEAHNTKRFRLFLFTSHFYLYKETIL